MPVMVGSSAKLGRKDARSAPIGVSIARPAVRMPKRRVANPEMPSGRISALDGRSAEARFLKKVRLGLIAHVGGSPSATQAALIDQAAQLALRIRLMDVKFQSVGLMSEHDSRTYLAWSNSYTRTVARLGVSAAEPPPRPPLAQVLSARGAR